jgi:hypothetical protein
MFEFNPSIQDWNSIPNTNAKTFNAGEAYAILVRGDRATNLNSNNPVVDSTTLRTTGQIHVGDLDISSQLSSTIGHYNLIGNPYQSQVDLNLLLGSSNPNSQGLDDQYVYIYDPTLGDKGGYATVDINSNTVTDVDAGTAVPADSQASKYLQPQQAFFVESTGGSPMLIFTEDTKNNTIDQTQVFSTEDANSPAVLDITLKDISGRTFDGVRLVFDSFYTNSINNLDATKFWNNSDNLSILSNSNYLSVEKRSIPSDNEVTTLHFYGQTLSNYSFELNFHSSDNTNFDAFLVDNYTGINTVLNPDSNTTYNFSVDASLPMSMASDRFSVIYNNSTLGISSPENFQFLVYPNPIKASDILTIVSNNLDFSTIKSIEINNIQGQIIKRYKTSELNKNGNSVQLNIKSLISKGTYLLKIIANENNYICKLIII